MIENRNVLYISDTNQAIYAFTNAYMVLSTSSNITVNLLLLDIDGLLKDKLSKLKEHFNLQNLKIKYIESNDYELGKSKVEHITNTTNVRLYVGEIYNELDNVLYLDNDTVVDGDLNELFDFVEENKNYGRPWSKWDLWPVILRFKGLFKNKYYVNAGVLFLNLKDFRENNMAKKLSDFLIEKEKKILFADQDVLNCNIYFNALPWKWNLARNSWRKTENEIAEKSKLSIYHFLSRNKQWDTYIKNNKKKSKGDLKKSEQLMLEKQKTKWLKYFEKVDNFKIEDEN